MISNARAGHRESSSENKTGLDSVDTWLLQQPTLINARKKKLHPALLERQQFSDALAKYLQTLGLKRRAKSAQSLGDLLAQGNAST